MKQSPSIAKAFMLVPLILLSISAKAAGPSAAEALNALKELQLKCETGMTNQEYQPALNHAGNPVHRFLDASGSRNFPEFAAALKKALACYQDAGKVLLLRNDSGYFLSGQDPDLFETLKRSYPDLKLTDLKGVPAFSCDEAVQLMWVKAASEIEKASDSLPAGSEESLVQAPGGSGEEDGDAARLKQRISELQQENQRLRKENKELRKEIDRRKARQKESQPERTAGSGS